MAAPGSRGPTGSSSRKATIIGIVSVALVIIVSGITFANRNSPNKVFIDPLGKNADWLVSPPANNAVSPRMTEPAAGPKD